jgi:GTP-binding protein
MVANYRAAHPAAPPRRPVVRPVAVDDSGFTVEPDAEHSGAFVVHGVRPERWVSQTNFDNDEAVGYLGDRLARLGVEDELLRLGATPGCEVTIGEVSFGWEPQTPAGADVVPSGRGTDARLDRPERASAAERKAARRDRRSQTEEQTSTDERLREEQTSTDERLREEQTSTDERLREEQTSTVHQAGDEP